MLSHFTIEADTPPRDSASRPIPTTRIKARNGLQNATYSDRRLPKIVISSPCPRRSRPYHPSRGERPRSHQYYKHSTPNGVANVRTLSIVVQPTVCTTAVNEREVRIRTLRELLSV